MLDEEGLAAVWDRHARHGEATRRAVRGWGLEVQCADPREYSASVTAVVLPPGYDANQVRQAILDKFDMSLGIGLGRLAGRVFRIGHLGHFNDLTLAGALSADRNGPATNQSAHRAERGSRRARLPAHQLNGRNGDAASPAGEHRVPPHRRKNPRAVSRSAGLWEVARVR